MKNYIGTKVVNATPMKRLHYNTLRGWPLPANEDGTDAGYLVEYTDGGKPNHPNFTGYISWSPKAQFDSAYRETAGMPFGLAIEAMKKGARIARAGWNGKGMFVYFVPANAYPVTSVAAKHYFGPDAVVAYNAYMAIKNVDESVSTWVPSVNDVLADDWHLLTFLA